MVMTTDFTNFLWRVFTLRDHFWHSRRFELPFAAIKNTPDAQGLPPLGSIGSTWGLSTQNLIPTGPCHVLSLRSTIEEQADWLRGVDPGYVLAYPSVLRAIAEVFESRGWRLPRLQSVTTFGEILEPQCRAYCGRVFGVNVVDMYSSEEVGYIALQCPQHEHYHVQAENVLVEVLDEDGQACKPGMTGRVVVTTLHNFAMPLLRYDIGDFAEVGDPCPCGRGGLPVLKRILGRHRNVLVLPSGERRSPTFSTEDLGELPSFFQYQIVQRTVQDIELNVVRPTASISPEEQATVERVMHRALGYPCRVTIRCVDSIPRSPRGKFELLRLSRAIARRNHRKSLITAVRDLPPTEATAAPQSPISAQARGSSSIGVLAPVVHASVFDCSRRAVDAALIRVRRRQVPYPPSFDQSTDDERPRATQHPGVRLGPHQRASGLPHECEAQAAAMPRRPW